MENAFQKEKSSHKDIYRFERFKMMYHRNISMSYGTWRKRDILFKKKKFLGVVADILESPRTLEPEWAFLLFPALGGGNTINTIN